MTNERELRQAAKLFESFREKPAVSVTRRRLPAPGVAIEIGPLNKIEYWTTHGNKRVLYAHAFKKNCAPTFMVSADGRQLLLVGGRFRFTWRGIVDGGRRRG